MNFEQTYKKYLDGTATEEEKTFVENEIKKCNDLFAVIERQGESASYTSPVADETVKKAKKRFSTRHTVRTVIVSLIVAIVVVGAILGGVFGAAGAYAKKNLVVNKAQAESIAIAYVADNYRSAGKIVVTSCERELRMKTKLSGSVYVYEIEVFNGFAKFELIVDGKSGLVYMG